MDFALQLIFLLAKDSAWKKKNVSRVLTGKEKKKTKEHILFWEVRVIVAELVRLCYPKLGPGIDITGELLEIQKLGPYFRPAELEFAFL